MRQAAKKRAKRGGKGQVVMRDKYPPAQWRLLWTGRADGFTNMATDEAILLAVAQGQAPPTLRFYGWAPFCLSIGRHQSISEVDVERCRAAGIDIVRRPTGGWAILHAHELTYSIVALQDDPRLAGGVVESYRRLSTGLVAGLRLLGLDAVQSGPAPCRQEASACFHAPSDYEVTVRGRKILGSAQLRRRGAVLQHGSLPLKGDVARIAYFLRFASEDERRCLRKAIQERAITLSQALGSLPPLTEVVRALTRGMAQALNLCLIPGRLSSYERMLIQKLRREKYTSDEWNLER